MESFAAKQSVVRGVRVRGAAHLFSVNDYVSAAGGQLDKGNDTDYGSDLDTDGEQIVASLLCELAVDSQNAADTKSTSPATSFTESDSVALAAAVEVIEGLSGTKKIAAAGTTPTNATPVGLSAQHSFIIESIEQDDSLTRTRNREPPTATLPKTTVRSLYSQQRVDEELDQYLQERRQRSKQAILIEYNEPSRRAWSLPPEEADHDPTSRAASAPPRAANNTNAKLDSRSPLERFRTPPKKPLSVTDLVSPAWCELQYWYSLTIHGKKRRTPAMKQGSAVHKVLEEQVHTTVPVTAAKTKEEFWGLRIWNVIQGLRTLREFGLTRELEVWGVVEGEVVNGVIDELSYTEPAGLEAAAEESLRDMQKVDTSPRTGLVRDRDSQKITDFFALDQTKDAGDPSAWMELLEPDKKIYITDVKTRGTKSLPQGASLRPTFMQLMLYHRMVRSLATDTVDPSVIFDRYRLDSTAAFSDMFIAEVSSLGNSFPSPSRQEGSCSEYEEEYYTPQNSQHDAFTDLIDHNSLSQLWKLMISEYRRTFPHGASSVGDYLQAEFRRSWDGGVIGTKLFKCDDEELDTYIKDGMKWWRGEREARGVEIEEAFKCRICEFSPNCGWRLQKVEEAVEKQRLKKSGRVRKSAV